VSEGRWITRTYFRLAARWKDNDIHADVTPRFGGADLRYIMDVLNTNVMKELDQRGYDTSTMRFHIDMKPESVVEHKRRAGPDSPYVGCQPVKRKNAAATERGEG
jgi:hypothetical protein